MKHLASVLVLPLRGIDRKEKKWPSQTTSMMYCLPAQPLQLLNGLAILIIYSEPSFKISEHFLHDIIIIRCLERKNTDKCWSSHNCCIQLWIWFRGSVIFFYNLLYNWINKFNLAWPLEKIILICWIGVGHAESRHFSWDIYSFTVSQK